MERRQSEALSAVLLRYLREADLEGPLNEYRLLQAWSEVVGETVAKQSTGLYIRNQTLFVHIATPALRANLMMERARLVKRLNQTVKADVITNIVLS